MSEAAQELKARVAALLGADVNNVRRLSAGASRAMWAVDLASVQQT